MLLKLRALLQRPLLEKGGKTYTSLECSTFKQTEYLGRISTAFDKGDNFCDFLFALLYINHLPLGANSFLLE